MSAKIYCKAICLVIAILAGQANAKKIVILMISDGQGFNTLNAANMYLGENVLGSLNFDVKMAMQTYSASNEDGAYDANAMWNDMKWAKKDPTDSAAAATAIYTGVKTNNGRINFSTSKQPLKTFFEIASENGLATGAVSTVQFSHATPAAVAAHNSGRGDYSEIAKEMIYRSGLDVIMGAGHPDFTNNGNLRKIGKDYKYVGGKDTWEALEAGKANGFTLIDSRQQFEQLAVGTLPLSKVVGVVQAATTAQQARSKGQSRNINVPSLATMSLGALNVLNKDPDGFAVMVEGGATDWANHANQKDRMIEEQVAFLNAVKAVDKWITAHNLWKDTLLIVTADHETGFITGVKDSFADIGDNGVGKIPAMAYNHGRHTNSLVPFFAKGSNAKLFSKRIVGTDTIGSAAYFGINDRSYIDNTSIFAVIRQTFLLPVLERK